MKIKIKDSLEYDDTKKLKDQMEDVKHHLLSYIDGLNSNNCVKKDQFGRPEKWVLEIEEIEITYERTYSTSNNERKLLDTIDKVKTKTVTQSKQNKIK